MSHQFVFTLGISCQSCVSVVETALESLNLSGLGLSNQRTDLTNKKLFIDFDESQTQNDVNGVQKTIIKAITKLGIDCQFDSCQPAPDKKTKQTNHWLLGSLGLATGLGLMLLTFFTGGLTLPVMIAVGLASTALTIALGYNSFISAYKHARYSKTMTMDTLFSISTLTVLSVSLCALFIPGLPMMFEAGLMLFGFRHIGLGIENVINQKSGVQKNFTDRIAKTVTLKSGKTIETSQIRPGDEIILQNGDVLPVDGVFINATPMVSNAIRTGSDNPVQYLPDQVINAGARIDGNDASYSFKASDTVANSYLAKLDNLLLSAQQNKAPVEYYTDKLLNYFIPAVLGLALLSGLVIGIWFSPILAIQCATAVLVTACPCTLGMIVPITMKIGMQKGLNHGVSFKSREAIEQASRINQIVFDLNGTLTQGTPKVQQCQISSKMPQPHLWQLIYFLEKNSMHPIGKSLAAYAKDKLPDAPFPIFSDIDAIAMKNGCKATINVVEQSFTYCIGNVQCMRDQGVNIEGSTTDPSIYLAENDKIIARFVVIDPLRKNAITTIEQLQQSGKKVYLLTGADETTANFYGERLRIPKKNRFANQTPEDKQLRIEQLQNHGLVAMVGDGGNDAVAMQQSDLGIAMHSPLSDPLADQQAQVLISDQSVLPVGHIFHVANQTMSTLKQNLWFSFAYNTMALMLTGGVLAALGFAMNPAVGAGLMVLQTSLILLNTYRLTYQKVPTVKPNATEKQSFTQALSSLGTAPVFQPPAPSHEVAHDAGDVKSSQQVEEDITSTKQQSGHLTEAFKWG